MEKPLRTATSSDGQLTLELFDMDDYSIGFQGQEWHTHGDLLVPRYGATPKEAATYFFDSIVSDLQHICVLELANGGVEIWITDDYEAEYKYITESEKLIVRNWSGSQTRVSCTKLSSRASIA